MLSNVGSIMLFLIFLLGLKLIPFLYLRKRNSKLGESNNGIDLQAQDQIDQLTKSTILSNTKETATKVTKLDKLMMKLDKFLSSNFFLMMVHGLQMDFYLAIFVNLSASLE